MRLFVCSFILSFLFVTLIKAQNTGILHDTDDGRKYKTIKIGNQWWMAENLNYYTSEGSWCYNNDSINCVKYGRLYTWETAKKVCPRGWHVPSKEEFQILIDEIENGIHNAYEQLLLNGTSGFDAVLGGCFTESNTYYDINVNGYYWTSSKDYLDHIWYLNLYSENNNAFFYFKKEMNALSVRCLKN